MLSLNGILSACYVIVWVTFVDVDMTQGYDFWRGDVSSIFVVLHGNVVVGCW